MSPAALTDAAVHRMIRRILTAPSTTSDSLLVLADGLDEASRWTEQSDAAGFLADHAAALRVMAPCFADRTPAAPPAAVTPLEAARILIQHTRPSAGDLAALLADTREYSPMYALLGLLLSAAKFEADAAEARRRETAEAGA
jgi:hypothetical protein